MHEAVLHPVTRYDDKYAIGAVCHDTIEDHPDCEERFANTFGFDNYSVVMHLTNRYTKEAYPTLNRATRKALEVERLSVVDDPIKVIKMLDRLDNLRSYRHDCYDYKENYSHYSKDDPTAFAIVYAYESISLLWAIGGADPELRDKGLWVCRDLIDPSQRGKPDFKDDNERKLFESLSHLESA